MANRPTKITRVDGVTQTYHLKDAAVPTPTSIPSSAAPVRDESAALAAAIDVQTGKYLTRVEHARGPQSRRGHERFFAAHLANLDGLDPVTAAYLRKCYRDAEAATSFQEEMTTQRALLGSVTGILFPGASGLTFTYIHHDQPVLTGVTDQTGAALYTSGQGTPAQVSRAHAIEGFLGGFPKDVLLDYFDDAPGGYLHRI
jgi:hypothetical protein